MVTNLNEQRVVGGIPVNFNTYLAKYALFANYKMMSTDFHISHSNQMRIRYRNESSRSTDMEFYVHYPICDSFFSLPFRPTRIFPEMWQHSIGWRKTSHQKLGHFLLWNLLHFSRGCISGKSDALKYGIVFHFGTENVNLFSQKWQLIYANDIN